MYCWLNSKRLCNGDCVAYMSDTPTCRALQAGDAIQYQLEGIQASIASYLSRQKIAQQDAVRAQGISQAIPIPLTPATQRKL